MNGVTGTCYSRAMQCWKGMLILDLARGGWVNVYHGNMELITGDDAAWLQKFKDVSSFTNQRQDKFFWRIPGVALPYGFKAKMRTLWCARL